MKKRILVVDDNPTNLKLAAELLEYSGYDVARTTDAESALIMIRANAPELVLLDVQLPGMDGLALTRILKSDATTRHVPIVAVSAYAMKTDQQRALDAGCDGYIAKPIDVETFPDQIAKYLKVKSTGEKIS